MDFQNKKQKRNEEIKKYFSPGQVRSEEIYLETPQQASVTRHIENALAHWQGPEYETYARDRKWYLISTLILASIVAYALYSNSPVMAITFILIGVVGYINLQRDPRVLDFALTEKGVIAGKEIFEFDNLESFWIFYEPPHTKILSLKTKGRIMPFIHIPIHQEDPVHIREILLNFMPEKKQEPSMADTLERLLHL